jgi:hypothetical protein
VYPLKGAIVQLAAAPASRHRPGAAGRVSAPVLALYAHCCMALPAAQVSVCTMAPAMDPTAATHSPFMRDTMCPVPASYCHCWL